MSELKACPFCGGKAEVGTCGQAVNDNLTYYVQCDNCDVRPCTMNCDTEAEAVSDWNKRAPTPPQALMPEIKRWMCLCGRMEPESETYPSLDRYIKESDFQSYILGATPGAQSPEREWMPIETAPNHGYHLLADSSAPHLSGIFLGQVLDGRPWNVWTGEHVKADLWMPLILPLAQAGQKRKTEGEHAD